MRIPWKSLLTKGWRLLVLVIRATAPDRQQADPPAETPKEPSADETFDAWQGGGGPPRA